MGTVGLCLRHSLAGTFQLPPTATPDYLLVLCDASALQAQGADGRKAKAAAFTREELRRLFSLEEATACETAALLRPAAASGDWEVCRAFCAGC